MPDTRTAPAGERPRARRDGQGPGRDGGSPLFRNAYALMVNTGISAILGLGFWLAAARYYSDDAVGQGSAAIAAMKLLAGLAALTLTGALARFIPVAGRATGRLIVRTYAGSSVFVALAAVVFLLTLGLWGESYRFLHGPAAGAGFVAAVVLWSLLTLQDGVLTGLRSAFWVPVGNTAFSVVKLVLLVAIAAALPTTGVFVSWVAAIAVSVVPLGFLVFRRLVPRHARGSAGRVSAEDAGPPKAREIGRFLAGDYTGSLFALAVVYLVPVLVAAQVGSADNAYFYVTATIGSTVNLLAVNMGASLTVEGAHDPARLAENCRAALIRIARIVLPVALFLFLFAPWILAVFGAGYAEAATPLLRWLAVGSVLRVVVEVYFGVLRAQSRTSGLAVLQGALCVLVLALTLVLLPRMGLTGAGVAEAASMTVIAAVAGCRLFRVLRASRAPSGTVPARDGADGTGRPGPGASAQVSEQVSERGAGQDQGREHGQASERTSGQTSGRSSVRTSARAAGRTCGPPGTPGPAPVRRPARWPARRPEAGAAAGWLLLAGGLALYWLPLRGTGDAELDRMGGLGLVTVLPGATLLGAALLVAAFAAGLASAVPRRALLTATLLLTVVSLHALPAVLEAEPRFATAWQHLGFLDHLERTGTAAPDLDARWSWPAFFAVAAFAAEACGLSDPAALLRWWPTVLQLLYLAPVALLLRSVRAHPRARWTALWLFALCGWVGQDYFSPQGFTYLLYLVFVAVLLVWFREARVLPGRFRPGEAETPRAGRADRVVLLLVLLGLYAAAVAAHQLTPFVMLGVLAALVAVGRSSLRGLPLLCAVMVAVWVGYLAEPYWSGHFDALFGGIGGLGDNVSSSVAGRIEGGSTAHRWVLYTRVALAGGVVALACAGWWRRRLAGYSERSLLVLALVPFLALGLQSYGGEMALRVFLFAVPGLCVLAALALFPRVGAARARRAVPAVLLTGLVLMGGFLVARWGNEPFERVHTGEVAAMEYVYAHDQPTVRLLWLSDDPVENVTPALPWGARDMARVAYLPTAAPRDPAAADPLVSALGEAGPRSYLVVNRSQSRYLELDSGYPPRWEQRLLSELDRRPALRRVLSNEHAVLYALREQPPGPVARPDPGPPGPRITWTSWSVFGALTAVLLMLLLAAREVVRVAAMPGVRAQLWLRGSLWFATPLVAVTLAALVHRFWTMS